MAHVIVSGIPLTAQPIKIILIFKMMLRRNGINRFWVREVSESPHLDYKQATIEFENEDLAQLARKALHNGDFNLKGISHRVTAHCDSSRRPHMFESGHFRRIEYSRGQRRNNYYSGAGHSRQRSRDRSRSPHYGREASKLDMEIELLRKQRLVIEEERRLLQEQKKLEMIKEYGPSAVKHLGSYYKSDSRGRRRSPERRRPLERRRTPDRPFRRFSPPKSQKRVLPTFWLPIKLLLDEMKGTINELASKSEIPVLLKLLRSNFRKRIAVLLEGKPKMPTPDIIKLYRDFYPASMDKSFIQKALENVKDTYWPSKLVDNVDEEMEAKAEGSNSNEEKSHPKDPTGTHDKPNEDEHILTLKKENILVKTEDLDDSEFMDETKVIHEERSETAVSLDASDIELSLDNHDVEDWDIMDQTDEESPIPEPKQTAKRTRTRPLRTSVMPTFMHPIRKLITDMRPLVEDLVSETEVSIVVKLLKLSLRRRLAVLVEGRRKLNTDEVLKLYRTTHPEKTDAFYILKVLGTLSNAYRTADDSDEDQQAGGNVEAEVVDVDSNEEKSQDAVTVDIGTNAKTIDVTNTVINVDKEQVKIDSNVIDVDSRDSELLVSKDVQELEDWIEGEEDWNVETEEENKDGV